MILIGIALCCTTQASYIIDKIKSLTGWNVNISAPPLFARKFFANSHLTSKHECIAFEQQTPKIPSKCFCHKINAFSKLHSNSMVWRKMLSIGEEYVLLYVNNIYIYIWHLIYCLIYFKVYMVQCIKLVFGVFAWGHPLSVWCVSARSFWRRSPNTILRGFHIRIFIYIHFACL